MSSKTKLRALINGKFGWGKGLIVLSNREPFVHERQDGRVVCRQPAGGVTSALDPVMSSCGGIWVAHGSGTADWEVVDRKGRIMVPPARPSYTLRRVRLGEKLRRQYYCGLANQALWPLCHHVYQRPKFSVEEWRSYREANAMFADAVAEEAGDGPALVFIQDYHFALVPRMLKLRNPRLVMAHFWHIPWPNAETFATFPWGEELLEGMLANDVVGFQTRQDCRNFMGSVTQASNALTSDNETTVRTFPIGIDFERHTEAATRPRTRSAIRRWTRQIGAGVRVGIGIDRMDYTKGIPERTRALDLFFRGHPEWREKLVFVQIGVPSRCEIAEYRELEAEIRAEVAAVNERWRTGRWQPILFFEENLGLEEMIALHRIAAFCLVTPLHDGMNLVAKEFVASREDLDGVLVLSRFAGAAEELKGAVLVNPFSEESIAEGVATALSLAAGERRRRMADMRAAVESNDVYKWAADIVGAAVQAARMKGEAWRPEAQPSAQTAGAPAA